MKISDYMSFASLFPLMGCEYITLKMGVELDRLFKIKYANKTCGSLITEYVENDTVSATYQEVIAKSVYLLNRAKWDDLFKFAAEDIDPWIDGSSTTVTTYGRKIDESLGGSDSYSRLNEISGFDSVNFVDDKQESNETTYGRTSSTQNSGTNQSVTTRRSQQAEKLMGVTMEFWERYGITRTVLSDAARALSLPLYELD